MISGFPDSQELVKPDLCDTEIRDVRNAESFTKSKDKK